MRLLKTFTKYATGSLFALLAGLITTPILTRLISTEEMGKYSMFITIGSLFASVLYLGLDQSYVRFYNDEIEEYRVPLLKKCMHLPLIATGVVSLLLLLFYNFFSNALIGEKSFFIALVFDFYLVGCVVDRFWMLKIRMVQKAGAYSALNVARKLSYLVIAIILYRFCFGDSCWSLIIAVSLAEYVLLFGCRFTERGNWSAGSVNKEKTATTLNEILKYGFPFIFSTTITLVFHSIDKIMLNALTDFNQVGLYSGAQNIVNLITQVQTVFTTFWVPVAYEHYSKNSDDKEFFIKVNKIISYMMLTAAIVLLCTKDIVILFLGKNYRDAAYVFPFLAFMPIMYTVSETTVMGINFAKKSSYHVWISMICAIANTVGNYFLILRYGAKGAAISTGLAYMVFFILRTALANKVYPVRFATTRFFISVAVVYLLAIMASFMDVTLGYVGVALAVFAFITFIYRDVWEYSFNLLKEITGKSRRK